VSQAEAEVLVKLLEQLVVKVVDADDGCTSGGQVVQAPGQPNQLVEMAAGAGGTQSRPSAESQAVEQRAPGRMLEVTGRLPGWPPMEPGWLPERPGWLLEWTGWLLEGAGRPACQSPGGWQQPKVRHPQEQPHVAVR
jgi:hypothetical protein